MDIKEIIKQLNNKAIDTEKHRRRIEDVRVLLSILDQATETTRKKLILEGVTSPTLYSNNVVLNLSHDCFMTYIMPGLKEWREAVEEEAMKIIRGGQ